MPPGGTMRLVVMVCDGWPCVEMVKPFRSTGVAPVFFTSNHSPQLDPPAAWSGSAMISLMTIVAADAAGQVNVFVVLRGAGATVTKSNALLVVLRQPSIRRAEAVVFVRSSPRPPQAVTQ